MKILKNIEKKSLKQQTDARSPCEPSIMKMCEILTTEINITLSQWESETPVTLPKNDVSLEGKKKPPIKQIQITLKKAEINLESDECSESYIVVPISERTMMQLYLKDVVSLHGTNWLTDSIMDFYLSYIMIHKIESQYSQKTHLFSVHFFNSLCRHRLRSDQKAILLCNSKESKLDKKRKNEFVYSKEWIKNVDIFSMKYLVIPANRDSHWFLYIIRNISECKIQQTRKQISPEDYEKSRPCILIYNSLSTKGSTEEIRDFLKHLWSYKKKSEKIFCSAILPEKYVSCVQQNDGSSCGLFVFHYLEHFFKVEAKKQTSLKENNDEIYGDPGFNPSEKRNEIFKTICDIVKIQ